MRRGAPGDVVPAIGLMLCTAAAVLTLTGCPPRMGATPCEVDIGCPTGFMCDEVYGFCVPIVRLDPDAAIGLDRTLPSTDAAHRDRRRPDVAVEVDTGSLDRGGADAADDGAVDAGPRDVVLVDIGVDAAADSAFDVGGDRSPDRPSGECGDGVVDPGEECDVQVAGLGELCAPDCRLNLGRLVFVSGQAGEEGNGSWEQPYRRIGDAVARAACGSLVLVEAGRYVEDLHWTKECPLWLFGDADQATVVEGSLTSLVSSREAHIYGLRFETADDADHSVRGLSHVVSHCHFRGGRGLEIAGSLLTVRNSVFELMRNQGAGVQSAWRFSGRGDDLPPGFNQFVHNTLAALVGPGTTAEDSGLILFPPQLGQGNILTDNIFLGIQADGVLDFSQVMSFGASMVSCDYNLFWCPDFRRPHKGYVLENQLRDGSDPAIQAYHDYDRIYGIPATPSFVDAAAGDFRLVEGSPGQGDGQDGEDMGAFGDRLDLSQHTFSHVASVIGG